MSNSLTLLFTKEYCEQIARDLSRLLAKNKRFARNFRIFVCFALILKGTWVIRSGHSWQKSHRERFAQVAHYKRLAGAIHTFSWANCSFAHKKRANHSENRRTNSQPWINSYVWNPVPWFVAPLYCNSILQRSKEIYLFNDKRLISRSLKYLLIRVDTFLKIILKAKII